MLNIRPISGRVEEPLALITGEVVVEVGGQEEEVTVATGAPYQR